MKTCYLKNKSNAMYYAKRSVKKLILHSKILHLANKISAKSFAILKYHSVQDKPELFDNSIGLSIIHKTSDFRDQMEIIAERFRPVTMDDIALFLQNKKKLPHNAVVVTFDDGFTDNFTIAAPILDQYGISATFYITAGAIENKSSLWFLRIRHALWMTKKKMCFIPPDNRVMKLDNREDRLEAMRLMSRYCGNLVDTSQEKAVREFEQALDVEQFMTQNGFMMNWNQIRKLHQSGHIIGSHTIHHPNVAHLENDDLYWELRESKRIIERELNSPVIHFSYPNPALHPHLNGQTSEALMKTGYQTAVISTPAGTVNVNSNPLSLKRVWVPDHRDDFLWHLEWTLLGRHM